jgi:CRP/FNR family transcriptional regulator
MGEEPLVAVLRRAPLFAGLSDANLAAFAASAVVRTCERGAVLFKAGDRADHFLLVLSGCVKVFALAPDGREHVLHLVSSYGLVAESAVFAEGTYPAWAQAEERSRVAAFFRDRFVEMIRRDPEFAIQCLAGMSHRLREFVAKIEDLSLRDVTARLAGYLLQNSRGGRCVLPVRKAVLAAHLGTVAEPLSRSLRRLKDAGIIREHKSAIHVLDADRLAELHEMGAAALDQG